MGPGETQYILYRMKTQGYILNGVPFEYSAARIRMDMNRAGFTEIPSEAEVENFMDWKRGDTATRILDMAREGRNIAEIRTWCEYSLDCPIPIPSMSQITAENILGRFDFFNFIIGKIVREQQIRVLRKHRKLEGKEFDISNVLMELKQSGIYSLQDEITKTKFYSEGELLQFLVEEEQDLIMKISEYFKNGLTEDEVLKRCMDENIAALPDAELKQLIEDSFRKYRIAFISGKAKAMKTNEIWTFIGLVESYQAMRISNEDIQSIASKTGVEPTILAKLKDYQEGKLKVPDDLYYHLSKLETRDLPQLSKLLRGFLAWRSKFHFLKTERKPESPQELMHLIVEGFSGENGVDPVLFEYFLY